MKLSRYFLLAALIFSGAVSANSITLVDHARERKIPAELYYPDNRHLCTSQQSCPVALLSAGYGVPHSEYSFLAEVFTGQGYLVVAIGHELPGDPPLSVSGNLYETRSENWQRGAATLAFVQQSLKQQLPGYHFDALTLVGHSNGGDISAWLGNAGKDYIKQIITLDHRRVPLPKTKAISVLSIRASDFAADQGVLPDIKEQVYFGSCVVKIDKARHNDMSDQGPVWLKEKIQYLVSQYLEKSLNCHELRKV